MSASKQNYYPENVTASYNKYFALRANKGLGERDVAELAGINVSILSRWRSGEKIPTVKVLYKIALALECQTTDMIDGLDNAV